MADKSGSGMIGTLVNWALGILSTAVIALASLGFASIKEDIGDVKGDLTKLSDKFDSLKQKVTVSLLIDSLQGEDLRKLMSQVDSNLMKIERIKDRIQP